MKSSFFSALIITILFCSTIAGAQVEVLVMNSITVDRNNKTSNSKSYIHQDKILMENNDEQSGSITLFDVEQETFYIINHKKKQYTEMTRQDMEALSNMVSEQMKMLEQQLENLPEAQREMARKQMGAAFGNQSAQSLEFKKEGSGEMVDNWETTKYVGMEGEEKKSEIYVASFQELDQDKSDFEAMEKLFAMMSDFAQTMSRNGTGTGFGIFSKDMPAFEEGIPVKTILYNDQGEAFTTSTIQSIEEEEVDEALFSIPENYEKKQMREAFME